jgi:DNA-3-methyladenine glycosylase I
MVNRCSWAEKNELMTAYHDKEWGVPVFDDLKLFEFLVLEGFQAGLSWQIVLNKREAFRNAFSNFDPKKIVLYNDGKINELLQNEAIIRNRQKITACIINAASFLEVQKEFGSFSDYIWRFTAHKPVINSFHHVNELPAHTALSDKLSKDLKNRGFKFVGSTIIYAHMQATGMVNDHVVSCFRYNELSEYSR